MGYFDIFKISFDDLQIIGERPEAIITAVKEADTGYVGEIIFQTEYPDESTHVLFAHEHEFSTPQEAYEDLDQIIAMVSTAYKNTKQSESIRNDDLSV